MVVDANGSALVTGVLDVTINGTEKLSGVDVTISLAKLRALNMTLGEPDYLDEPIMERLTRRKKLQPLQPA